MPSEQDALQALALALVETAATDSPDRAQRLARLAALADDPEALAEATGGEETEDHAEAAEPFRFAEWARYIDGD